MNYFNLKHWKNYEKEKNGFLAKKTLKNDEFLISVFIKIAG